MNPIIKKLRALFADVRPFSARLKLAACAMLALCFTFIFFGPYEQVAFNGSSFSYQHDEVLLPLAAAMLICTAAGALILSLLRGKVFNYAVSAVFSLGVCCYLQGSLLNGSLGLLTGDSIDWSGRQGDMLIGLAVWFAVFFAVYMTLYLSRRAWRALVTYASMALIFMQLVPAVCIAAGVYEETKASPISSYALHETGMYEFSREENILVFVLDRLDYDYLIKTQSVYPDLLNNLDGFTHYTDAISTYAHTRPAIAHMLTGVTQGAYSSTPAAYYQSCWTEGGRNILSVLRDQGYSIELYSSIQDLFSDPLFAAQYVSNISNYKGELKPVNVLKRLMVLSAYRYFPLVLKPFFWADTIYYNTDVYVRAPVYRFNDSGYAPGFCASTADRESASFKFYHFNGPHAPFYMNADGTDSFDPTSLEEQTAGTFAILNTIFDRLKELGVYDSASIIITADHGDPVYDTDPIVKPTRIGLFYKPAGSSDTPVTQSSAPVSTQNIAATIVKAADADHSAFGTALDEIAEGDDVLRSYYKSILDPHTQAYEIGLYTYHVRADASILDNWEEVEYLEIPREYGF